MSARIAGARLHDVAGELSARDWSVLEDVARVRLLCTRQVERLHFTEGSQLTQARRSRRTLERLNELGVLHRFERRVGGVHGGSAGFVYGLDTLGQRLLDTRGPAGGIRRRRPWEPSALFFRHVLAVSKLYVELREAERGGSLELLSFDAEPACWRLYLGLGGETSTLKPDASVAVGVGAFEEHAFVEVDLGTESLSVIRRKAEAYVRYWQTGREQSMRGVFPRVLLLVTSERRRELLVKTLTGLPAEHSHLFVVAKFSGAVGVLAGGPA